MDGPGVEVSAGALTYLARLLTNLRDTYVSKVVIHVERAAKDLLDLLAVAYTFYSNMVEVWF